MTVMARRDGDNTTLHFTASNWNSVRTVTVKGVADNLSDGDQAYTIVLTGDNSRRIFALRMWIPRMFR